VILGRAMNARLSPHAFVRYVYIGLAAVGLALMVQSLAQVG